MRGLPAHAGALRPTRGGEALGCGQPRADSVDTLRLIPLPTGSNNKTCQRSGLFLFLSDGTDNLLLILKLQMN